MSRNSVAQHHPASQPPPRPPRTVRLRSVLLAILVAVLAPALGTAALAILQSADAHRKASVSRLADTARALAHTLEGDLSTKASLLQAMATGIGSGGIVLPQAQAWLDGLRTGQGRFVLSRVDEDAGNGTRPTPQDLPPTVVREALAGGGVSLSNLFEASDSGLPTVALSVPLPPRDGAQLLLSLVLPASQVLSLAPQQGNARDSLLVAVVDGTGRLVARSRDGARFVGRPAPDWDKMRALGTSNGQLQVTTSEGGAAVIRFETLARTPGWVVAVGEPRAEFDQAWQRPLRQLAVGSAIGVLAALLVALWLARAIARPVRDLARNAQAVAAAPDGAAAPAVLAQPSLIAEFESMRHSIEAAQATLQARAESERRNAQALALNEMRYRTLARTGAVVLWRGTPDGMLTSVDGWEMLTGEPDMAALGHGWHSRVHPDDHPAMQTPSGARQMDVEFRVARADNSWCWVRGRAAAMLDEDGQVREWVGVLEDVSERHRAQARIAHMALHDALTDLPNRVEFRNRLNTAIRRAGRGDASAVLYIDLDRFKAVNDTLGHPAGDALLQAVTARLRALLRQDDTVARLAGDEFAIIQSNLTAPSGAADLAARVVQSLSEPYDIAGHRVEIGASVGIMPVQDDRQDADQLLKYADLALYRAKQDGRGRYCFFESEMDARMQARRQSEADLRDALAHGTLALRYTPVVDGARRLCGLAARLHWNHPQHGLVAAPQFAALADELGLSGQLVEWSLQRLCSELVAWPECPKAALDISAALRWGAPAALRWVDAAVAASGLAPDRLELALSEPALLTHPEVAAALLKALRQRGVRTALSGFGACGSALGRLQQLPLDKLALDATAWHGGGAGVHAMQTLCAGLGIVLGAEGVDSEAHAAAFTPHARVELQGSLFGADHDADAVAQLCRSLPAAA